MYYFPGYNFGAMRQNFSYIRFLHAVPGAPAVDVYANESLIARGLSYRGFTEYLQVVPGIYSIQIFAAGTTGPTILDTVVEVPVQSIITAAVAGMLPNIGVRAFFEPILPIPPGKLYLRFANLVPDSTGADLTLSDGTILFEDVSFGTATNYISIFPGIYAFNVKQSGTDTNLLYVPNIQLEPARFYTVYFIGSLSGNPPLQVLIPLDGNSYIPLR